MQKKTDEPVLTEAEVFSNLIKTTPIPVWAQKYTYQAQSDGRLFLHGVVDGGEVWYQPKEWKAMKLEIVQAAEARRKIEPPTTNYGVMMQDLPQHAGKLETNDNEFGQAFMTGSEHVAPLPTSSARDQFGPYTVPCLILVVGMVLIAIIHRIKKRPS